MGQPLDPGILVLECRGPRSTRPMDNSVLSRQAGLTVRRPCLARLAVLAEALAVELSWHLSVPRRRPRPEIPRRERVHRAIGPPPPPPPLPPPPDGRGPAGRPGPGRPVVITAVGPPRDAGGRGAGWIQQLPVGGRLPPGESLNTPPVAATDPRRRVRVDPQSSAVLAARWRRGASRSRKDTTI